MSPDPRPTPRFEIRETVTPVLRRRRWHTVLIAANGEILMTSEPLNSEASAMHNIEATKALAAAALVVRV